MLVWFTTMNTISASLVDWITASLSGVMSIESIGSLFYLMMIYMDNDNDFENMDCLNDLEKTNELQDRWNAQVDFEWTVIKPGQEMDF